MDILELLKGQIAGPLMERMGGLIGLDGAQAQKIGQAVLPAQLAALRQQASTPAGAQRVLDLVAQLPREGSQEPLDTAAGLEQVRRSGSALLPQLLGERTDATVEGLAAQTGAGREGVQGMMQMILPLVLGLIGQQVARLGLNAGTLGSLFGAANPVTAPGASVISPPPGPATGLGVAGLGAAGLGTAGTDGMATVGAGAGLGGGVLHTNQALGGRRGMGRLWLLPLLLLLLLGGCFLLRGRPAIPFAVTERAGGSVVSSPFAVKGTGTAGQEVTVSENGQPLGRATVGQDGTFSAAVPAPSAGEHTYALTEAGAGEALNLTVRAAAAAAVPGAGDAVAGTNGGFSVLSPAAGASLPAGAFALNGRGKPGDVLEIFEDGVSLGKVTVGADGGWTLNVPSPAAGAHTYTVRGADGAELGRVPVTLAAAAAGTGNCPKAFSLSIPDGQTVAEPFRFGGQGSGRSYTVTVTRGDHTIGSKVLPLDGTCGYSYTSKPGKGTITYSVAPDRLGRRGRQDHPDCEVRL